MRVELRLEENEREFAVTVEADQGVEWDIATQAAVNALDQIKGGYKI